MHRKIATQLFFWPETGDQSSLLVVNTEQTSKNQTEPGTETEWILRWSQTQVLWMQTVSRLGLTGDLIKQIAFSVLHVLRCHF